MKRLRVFRVNGDSLSCWFSPQGALSSATLHVEGEKYDVTGQLPGLTEEVAVEYLAELGYTGRHAVSCIDVGKQFNDKLCSTPLFVESVQEVSGSFVISVALVEDRERAMCRRVLVGVRDSAHGTLRLEAVRDSTQAALFSACTARESESII